jgi:tetrahydromethanopterin S-methyltransferase subunit A
MTIEQDALNEVLLLTRALAQSHPRPTSDPTELTTKQLHREIEVIRDALKTRDGATDRLMVERFERVEQQFTLIERMRVEQKNDTKAAVDAALTAQKEAVKEQTTASDRAIAKSEAATGKQLEQLSTTFTATIDGLTALLNDTKERVVKNEATAKGGDGSVSKMVMGYASTLAAVIAVAISIILALKP